MVVIFFFYFNHFFQPVTQLQKLKVKQSKRIKQQAKCLVIKNDSLVFCQTKTNSKKLFFRIGIGPRVQQQGRRLFHPLLHLLPSRLVRAPNCQLTKLHRKDHNFKRQKTLSKLSQELETQLHGNKYEKETQLVF